MYMTLWGSKINLDDLSESERSYIESLPIDKPAVDWVWEEMDRIWYDFGLNNKVSLSSQKNIAEFYRHPVWIMNGVFTEVDPVSSLHREAISTYLINHNCRALADYGGGSGVLAKVLTNKDQDVTVDIVEPFASDFFKSKARDFNRVEFKDGYTGSLYDAVIAQDVLEHVENPIEIAYEMALHTKHGGVLVFANCFYPVIQCHLPITFYLRYTFPVLMKVMGLEYLGTIPNAQHALIFRNTNKVKLEYANKLEKYLKLVGFFLNIVVPVISRIRYSFNL